MVFDSLHRQTVKAAIAHLAGRGFEVGSARRRRGFFGNRRRSGNRPQQGHVVVVVVVVCGGVLCLDLHKEDQDEAGQTDQGTTG